MSDTKYKRTPPTTAFRPASSADLSNPSELRRPPAEAITLSQDSIGGGRRTLLSRTMGGSHSFLVNNVATGGVSQGKPDAVTWRRNHSTRTEQQPGTELIIRILAVPSGASEYDSAGGSWPRSGVSGQVRVLVRWDTLTGFDEATFTHTIDGEEDEDGVEQQGLGAQWANLRHYAAVAIRPTNAANDFEVAQQFAEWPTVTIHVEDRGGARVLQVSVGEVPAEHIALDTQTTDVTFTGSKSSWETDRPQIEAPDGANFEEHRYGIYRSLDVAARQTHTIGPIIGEWSAYSETSATVTDTDVTPRSTSLATWSRISRGLNTVWDTNEVGLFIMGTNANPDALRARGRFSTVRARVRALVRFSAPGAGNGAIRFDSSTRSRIEIQLDQATIGDTWTWVTTTGWLEASLGSQDFWPTLQDFYRSDGAAEVEVRAWAVSYGWHTVAA